MKKLLALGMAVTGLTALASGCASAWQYIPSQVRTTETQLESGLTREEKVICHDNGTLELQLKYMDAQRNTRFFLSLARNDGLLYCSEVITAVNAMQEFPVTGILYDDGCDMAVDRFSQGLTGDTRPRVLHYRIINSDANNETNDNEFAALRNDIDSVLDIERQIEVCEAMNE